MEERNAITKFELQLKLYLALLKEKPKWSKPHMYEEEDFTEKLNTLLNVAYSQALSMINITEDHHFLQAHLKPRRRGCIILKQHTAAQAANAK